MCEYRIPIQPQPSPNPSAPTGRPQGRTPTMPTLTLSDRGLALTKSFEGLRLSAYQDSAGIWTIGYGHTGPDVHPNLTLTEPQAEALLRSDLAAAETCVNRSVHVPLTQPQFDALVDFTFNTGRLNFQRSTLLRLINLGNFPAAATQFPLWTHAAGQTLPGLVRRRAAEAELFSTDSFQRQTDRIATALVGTTDEKATY